MTLSPHFLCNGEIAPSPLAGSGKVWALDDGLVGGVSRDRGKENNPQVRPRFLLSSLQGQVFSLRLESLMPFGHVHAANPLP